MKKRYILIALLITLLCVGCKKDKDASGTNQNKTDKNAEVVKKEDISFLDEYIEDIIVPEFKEIEIVAKVEDYKIEKNLKNVYNYGKGPYEYMSFKGKQLKALEENGFVVGGNGYSDQPFQIYEVNEYTYVPSFVTTDSVLHLYHIFYDSLLREVETKQFLPNFEKLIPILLEKSIADYENADDESVKNSALKNIAYFKVAGELINLKTDIEIPQAAEKIAKEEMKLIKEGSISDSNLVNAKVDYSQFKVRGHYTRTKELEKYFKVIMLFSQEAFFIDNDGIIDKDNLVQAMLITKNLFENKENYKLWEDVNSSLNFLVEKSDDLDVLTFAKTMYSNYGKDISLEKIKNEKILEDFYNDLSKLSNPAIQGYKGKSFRFMPQKAVIDNVLMQNLVDIATEDKPSYRPIYSGVDVMAVLGNKTAEELVLNNENNFKWDKFKEKYEYTKELEKHIDEKSWMSNLYRGLLWTLKGFNQDFAEGYPKFMQSKAWKLKDLNTALASWAELKHDTVLYGKQVGAEMGGGDDFEFPVNYVEPNVKIYERLLWLMDFAGQNLKHRNMLSEATEKNLNNFKDMVQFLLDCSVKELREETLTKEENERIFYIGGEMENIFVKFIDEKAAYYYEIETEADKDMACIADIMKVAKNSVGIPEGKYLEVGSGHASLIYVIYKVNGKLYLGEGAVMSYYEFLSDDRLTDEQFQEKLNSFEKEDYPERPDWISGFVKEYEYILKP
ncbi:DUF3160 domain-containing protein [Peptoniphilus mikwangii]|uniref:DUF3160 domain-containing protein n=1 Tax=Peptoniphilus mikwangii TaxID=1354300 RepID=UPI0003FB6223|nr:DUF3160 domain-containing protein [Peptoniphilus mikwangii]